MDTMTTEVNVIAVDSISDADLVSRTLAGDRDAFNRIVSRYQILICSLAYSQIGHLGLSEDVAQETFITAWKRLRLLRQPDKLRAWLCGIVRNLTRKYLAREGRQPVHDAEALELVANAPAPEALPSDHTISREEEAMLWRALARLPQLYREPLILYYREHQSIEYVAVELDLSEDAVKQRLSRGRKMLQDEVESFLESALRKTAPTPAFSNAVLAALPLAGGPMAVAGVGAAKGTVAAKGLGGLWAVCLLPFIGIFTGFGAQWLMFRDKPSGHGPGQSRLILTWVAVVGFAVGGDFALQQAAYAYQWTAPVKFAAVAGFWWFYAMLMATWIISIYWRITAKDRTAEAAGAPTLPPVPPLRSAAIVAGTHLMMFWGLIFLSWQEHDRLGTIIIVGLMTALGIWNFSNMRKQNGAKVGTAYIVQLATCGALMLAIFNLRFDVWISNAEKITVAELHTRMPVWMVPLLTLVLVLWSVVVFVVAKPKRPFQCQ